MALRLYAGKYSFQNFLTHSLGSISRLFSSNMKAKDVKYSDFKDKLLKGEIIFIDVREPDELKNDGKIPNSINIPLGKIEEAFKSSEVQFETNFGISKPEKSDDFVISCRSGRRATNAFQKLVPLGYDNVSVYSGSFQDWVANGGPVEK